MRDTYSKRKPTLADEVKAREFLDKRFDGLYQESAHKELAQLLADTRTEERKRVVKRVSK